VYYKKQLPVLAVPQFEKCAQQDPTNPMYRMHLGLAYAQAGDTAKARQALEEALRLNPSFEGAAQARQTLASLKG
jgi:Flp pilus assembly protein TadD